MHPSSSSSSSWSSIPSFCDQCIHEMQHSWTSQLSRLTRRLGQEGIDKNVATCHSMYQESSGPIKQMPRHLCEKSRFAHTHTHTYGHVDLFLPCRYLSMKIFFTSLLPSIACPSWTMGNEEKERKEMLLLNGANPASFFGENVSRASTESLSHRWPPFFFGE